MLVNALKNLKTLLIWRYHIMPVNDSVIIALDIVKEQLLDENPKLDKSDKSDINQAEEYLIQVIDEEVKIKRGIYTLMAFKFYKKALEPVFLYFVYHRNEENFISKCSKYIYKFIAELEIAYFSSRSIEEFYKKAISEVKASSHPHFEFPQADNDNYKWKAKLRNPVREPSNYWNTQGLVLRTICYQEENEHQLMFLNSGENDWDFQIEHICPQAGNKNIDKIYTIGNLTLLEKYWNVEASDAEYCDKIECYKESHAIITKKLPKKYYTWSLELIDSRTEEMISYLNELFADWRRDYDKG